MTHSRLESAPNFNNNEKKVETSGALFWATSSHKTEACKNAKIPEFKNS